MRKLCIDRRPATATVLHLLAVGAVTLFAHAAHAERIKDIASVVGVRGNHLVGYGLVIGLAGTGDRLRNAPFTQESLGAMLERMGVNVRDTQPRTQNIAAVMVTATLPPFARAGTPLDVQVSAIGDASNLQGGTLVATNLKGLDGNVYAVAQGPVAVSGFAARGAAASVSRGSPTSARIAGGAIVEQEINFALPDTGNFRLALRNPDFTTASRVATAIRGAGLAATALDNATVEVAIPAGQLGGMTAAVGTIENLAVDVDQVARVVIDEASGTVVIGENVRVSKVAIAHGALTIAVTERPVVSQPNAFAGGQTAIVPRSDVQVDDGSGAKLATLDGTASLKSLVAGLNALGVSPRDLITILQALRTAGALQASIEVR
ncbi:flagellar basal body P-ring protein FlgI [Sandaracinobacteroides saxicola]|uniref:Flagellar P-ring protein n=2 Tax=Sandaracinobacteroides saxicola TaxID=2759707 RepID=A0A7G5IMC5_9SPHN|nr:flagellar basal body P-ring protein FlgI [Sandaracinobacteroides saxicola]